MKRRHLVELEDLSWWPRVFRDSATDYLVTAIRHAKLYDGRTRTATAGPNGADRHPGHMNQSLQLSQTPHLAGGRDALPAPTAVTCWFDGDEIP